MSMQGHNPYSTDILHRYLGNGMEVCLCPNDFAPLVSVHVAIKAGSIDERPGEEGIAHVLEHMLFKGTKKFPKSGQIAGIVESEGGDINAYTTFDHTLYYFSGPSDFTVRGSELLIDVVQNSLLDADELSRELEVIIEEIRRMRDNPNSTVSQNLFSSLYAGSPMARPVIGFEDVVKNLTRDTVYDFYKRWYAPNNMIFVAAGKFNPEELFAYLQQLTRDFYPASTPERVRPVPTGISSDLYRRINIVRGAFQEARVGIAVPAPAQDHESVPAWDMLSSILGSGDSSRFARNIRDQQIVTSIDAWGYNPRYPSGIFSVGFYGRAANVHTAMRAAVAEITRLATGGPSRDELTRVLSSVQASRIYAKESVEGIARNVGSALMSSQKLQYEEHYVAQLKAVTAADVQRHAKEVLTHLQNQNYAVSVALAADTEAVITEQSLHDALDIHSGSIAGNNPQAHFVERVSPLNASVHQIELDLPHGKKLRINSRMSNRLPITSCVLVARGGISQELPGKNGACSLLSEMLTRGTEKQSYISFSDELEDLSSSIGSFSARDLFGIRMDSLADNSARTLDMMLDCLFRPAFAGEEFEKAKHEAKEILVAQLDSASSRLSRLASPMIFGSHPYALPGQGTLESLEALDIDDIQNQWLQFFSASEFIFSIAGQFDLEAFKNAVLREFNLFFAIQDALPPRLDVGMAPAPTLQSKRFAYNEFEREQAHVSLIFRSFPVGDPRRTALELASSILGGQGGRLFMDLRDRQSLAYSLGASQSPHVYGGSFSAYIGTAAHKVKDAVTGLKSHIERLAHEPPNADELLRAQRSVIGSQAMDSQHYHYQASQLAISDAYGLGFDNFLKFHDRVMAVTVSDIQSAFRDLLAANPPILCIVGPKETWRPEEGDPVLKWNL